MLEGFSEGFSVEVSGKKILDNIRFELEPGEFLAVIGPNGSGKSTLLECIAAQGNPKHVALLRHSEAPWVEMTVQEYVALGRYPYVESSCLTEGFAQSALEFVSGETLKNQQVHTLSSGEFQRISFARALAQLGLPSVSEEKSSGNPRLLLLDELLAHLDPFYQLYFLERLKALKKVSVICVMHELNLAFQYADKFLMIKQGKCEQFGDQSVMTHEHLSALFNTKITSIFSACFPSIVEI